MGLPSLDLPAAPVAEGPGRPQKPLAQVARLQHRIPLFQIIGLIAVFVVGATTIDGFAGKADIYDMLTLASFLGFAAAGQTIVVLVGGVDLSIPAMIVLSGTIIAQFTGQYHWPFVAALALALAAALLTGAFTGFVCHFFGGESLIVTLGVSSVLTGVVQVWTGGFLSASPPAFLVRLSSPVAKTFGIGFPPVVVIWAILAVLMGFGLRRTTLGQKLYATGANPRASRLALVSTLRVWVATFALAAALSALTGVLLAGFAAGDQSVGDPYLFESLAAVIVGGTAFGARGDYWRTVLGALILTELTTVLIGHGYSDADQQMLYGVVILVVVAAYGRARPLRDRV
jgi:ribose transport system permease protein